MQWPGTSGVLEGRAEGTSGEILTAPAVSAMELSNQVFRTAELPCRDDPELFFAESPDDVEFAKSLCRSCAVRTACLAGALARGEPWGVWGGELFLQGVVIPRKRPRGRPRKNEVAA